MGSQTFSGGLKRKQISAGGHLLRNAAEDHGMCVNILLYSFPESWCIDYAVCAYVNLFTVQESLPGCSLVLSAPTEGEACVVYLKLMGTLGVLHCDLSVLLFKIRC